MQTEENKFVSSLKTISGFLLLLWLIKFGEYLFGISLVRFGLYPGSLTGLLGIASAPLIHGDFGHLISNTLPLFILGSGLLYYYSESSRKVIVVLWIVPGIFTWLIGRPSYHVGASGIIYGFVTFIFFSGVFRKDKRSITLALLTAFLYGGILWGILPVKEGVSWEYHLFGAISGLIMAVICRKKDPYIGYDWEDEDDEDDVPPEKLEIRWDKEPPF